MTSIVKEIKGEYTFVDDFLKNKCLTKITVTHKKYEDGREYYDIEYDVDVSVTNSCHPFYNYKKSDICDLGTIVFRNEITDSMIKYLFLDDSELSKFTGTTTPMSYRKIIIKMLDKLWD